MLRDSLIQMQGVQRGVRYPGFINLASNILVHPDLDALHRRLGLRDIHPNVDDYPSIKDEHDRFCSAIRAPSDQVLCGAGSDAILRMLYLSLRPPGGIVQQSPSYGSWYSGLAECEVTYWNAQRPQFRFDTSELLHVLQSRKSSVVFISDPNSPLGTELPVTEIEALLETARVYGHLIVMDTAYEVFGCPRRTVLAEDCLLTVRSLSKSFGVPGLRFGYLEGPKGVLGGLCRLNMCADISAFGWRIASLLAETREEFHSIWEDVCGWRDLFATELRTRGLDVIPSAGNYICVNLHSEEAVSRLQTTLLRVGIQTRDLGAMFGLSGVWRCTSPPPAEAAQILQVVDEVL